MERGVRAEAVLPTLDVASELEKVGKILEEVDAAVWRTYRDAGVEGVLEVLGACRGELLRVKRTVEELLDLTEVLKSAEEEARRSEGRGVTVRSRGGCYVVKYVPCGKHCSGCPHGPYIYHVTKAGGRQIWKYIGKR